MTGILRRLSRLFGLGRTKTESHAAQVSKLLAGHHPLAEAFAYGCIAAGVEPTYKQASKFLNGYGAAHQALQGRAA